MNELLNQVNDEKNVREKIDEMQGKILTPIPDKEISAREKRKMKKFGAKYLLPCGQMLIECGCDKNGNLEYVAADTLVDGKSTYPFTYTQLFDNKGNIAFQFLYYIPPFSEKE